MSLVTLRKKKERFRLTCSIKDIGSKQFPCLYCQDRDRKCVTDPKKSSKCTKCIRAHVPCDVRDDLWDQNVPRESDQVAIKRQEEQLDT